MEAEAAVLDAIACGVEAEVAGSKRLQKLVVLGIKGLPEAQQKSAVDSLGFYIHHYGPFSKKVASAVDELVSLGQLKVMAKPIGYYQRLTDTFSLSSEHKSCEQGFSSAVQYFSAFNTVPLELAATVFYYQAKGHCRTDAIDRTSNLKPAKSARYMMDGLAILDGFKS